MPVRNHLEGIVAWAQIRETNGFLEGLNGLFQPAKHRTRGFIRLSTIRTVIFLIGAALSRLGGELLLEQNDEWHIARQSAGNCGDVSCSLKGYSP